VGSEGAGGADLGEEGGGGEFGEGVMRRWRSLFFFPFFSLSLISFVFLLFSQSLVRTGMRGVEEATTRR